MATRRAYDAIIIGGGVLGNACALELARSGRRTLTIDFNRSAGYGSTSSSSSIIRVFYSAMDSCKLAWEGYHGWQNWADYLQAPPAEHLARYRQTGGLILDSGLKEDLYLNRVQRAMETIGIEHEVWDLGTLEQRLPYLCTHSYTPPARIDDGCFGERTGTLRGGLYTEHTGYMDDPQLAARNLSDAAKRHGAEFQWGAEVTGLLYNGSKSAVTGVLLSDGQQIEAPVVVNAAGPHSSLIHKTAFRESSIADDSLVSSRPMKVEVAVLPGPAVVDLDSTLPWVADNDLGIYYRPQYPGQLLVGGSEPACDPLHFLRDPEDFTEGFTEEWTNYGDRLHVAATRIPGLLIPNSGTPGVSAMYDVTPDWTPIYDRTALGGFYSLMGTSGNQFKNAPVVGKVLTQIIEHTESGEDHDTNPLQLDLKLTGNTLDCGVFSRLRESSETSGTVFG